MIYNVKVVYNHDNFLLKWDWSVLEPGQQFVSMTNPWRNSGYGFGSAFTKKGAYRAARGWISRYEKDVAKWGQKPEPEFRKVMTKE